MYFSVTMSQLLFYELQVTSSGTPYNNSNRRLSLQINTAYIIFWLTDLFWHENIFLWSSLLICTSFSRNNICKKLRCPRASSGHLLLNQYQRNPFALLLVQNDTSFIIHINTLISYCCFISASENGTEWARFKFALSWHRFNTRSVDFQRICS